MDIGASNWSETDANNNSASPDGFPEGMPPSGVNNGARAVMGALRRFYDWQSTKVTAGSATAYTLSYDVAPGALVDGMTHLVAFHATNGAAATLSINSLGAIPLYCSVGGNWQQIPAKYISANMMTAVAYHSSSGTYRMLTPINGPMAWIGAPDGSASTFDIVAGGSNDIPITVNNLHCFFYLNPSSSGATFSLQVYKADGSLDVSGDYYFNALTVASGAAITPASGTSSIQISTNTVDSGNAGFAGSFTASGIQAAAYTTFNYQVGYQSGGAAQTIRGDGTHEVAGRIRGIRFKCDQNLAGFITLQGYP